MILSLEFARGLAALWVFLFHARALFEASAPALHALAMRGHLGVPMFFVISGYVITHAAEACRANHRSPFSFLKARFLRIYPTFWCSVLVVLIVPYVMAGISALKTRQYLPPADVLTQLSVSEWSNLLLLSKVFWASSDDLQLEFTVVNAVYWTLAIEFQFYIVVCLALCLGRFFHAGLAAVTVASLAAVAGLLTLNHGLFLRHWPVFATGIALAQIHRHPWHARQLMPRRVWRAVCVVAALAGLFWAARAGDGRPLHQGHLVFGLCLGALLWAAEDVEQVLLRIKSSRLRWPRWLLAPWLMLGAMSYSVYLLHGKVYQLPYMVVRQVFAPDQLAGGVLTVLGTLVMCLPFYRLVERRFLSSNHQRLHQQVLDAERRLPDPSAGRLPSGR